MKILVVYSVSIFIEAKRYAVCVYRYLDILDEVGLLIFLS